MKKLFLILLMATVCGIQGMAQTGNTAGKCIAGDTLKTKTADENARIAACRRIFTDKDMAGRDTTKRLQMNKKAMEFKNYDSFREKMKEPWLDGILKNIFFK